MGMILAGILTVANLSALAFLLREYRSAQPQKAAKPTPKRHEPEYVTHEQLKEALEEVTKDLNYEWNEWYEKFDKLHLRLAKRADREKKRAEQQLDGFEETEPRPSVLNFRRLGSV